ncbi:MAG: T9SS type A sorting domain-containing protein [Bacteroidetes bacterium]|nr:MAG: T9SS type A sorting domain-containing protein [Bacteroidota bacterium]
MAYEKKMRKHFRMKHGLLSAALRTFGAIICSLLFSESFGGIYYAAANGSDSNPGTINQPFLTLNYGVSFLSAGDTLYVMSGTYDESLVHTIPAGTSWTAPVTVAAYPGDIVTLKPNAGAGDVLRFVGPQQYIVIDGLILDGVNTIHEVVKITWSGGGDAHHIRIQNCEIKNSPGQGILTSRDANYNEFINLKVHDNGASDFDHGLYIASSNNLVEGCEIYQNGGWGVHVYDENYWNANNNIIRANKIYNNARIGNRGRGIILSSGTDNIACNNLIWGNNGGIQINYNVANSQVYNNTIWANNGGDGLYAEGIYIGSGSSGAIIKNNICWQNNSGGISDYGAATTLSNNLTSDPQFVNAAGADFHLQPGSPAIDAGLNLSPDVVDDFSGTLRPQGLDYDIGAYEYTANPNSSSELPKTENEWFVYPAVGSGIFEIQIPIAIGTMFNIQAVEIYNMLGEKVYGRTINARHKTVNLSEAESGIYFVKILYGGKEKTQKIIIIK